jgi:antitoxin VapB
MGLSIKNEETERLVRELARRKGVGVTTAIRLAVSNELAKDATSQKDPEEIRRAIADIQARSAALGPMPSMKEMDDWLYDENGLPH